MMFNVDAISLDIQVKQLAQNCWKPIVFFFLKQRTEYLYWDKDDFKIVLLTEI